jgi:hypothetical protein
MKRMKKKLIVPVIVVILVLIQFIRIDKTNPEAKASLDYFSVTNPPEEIKDILRNACYDCHSNETAFPWYANVAPVSWMIKHHVNEGREDLNFSEWSNYPANKAEDINKECYEEISDHDMPLKSYTLMHPKAKLSPEQLNQLQQWFISQKKNKNTGPQPYEISV